MPVLTQRRPRKPPGILLLTVLALLAGLIFIATALSLAYHGCNQSLLGGSFSATYDDPSLPAVGWPPPGHSVWTDTSTGVASDYWRLQIGPFAWIWEHQRPKG
jgi:hypothetical protein